MNGEIIFSEKAEKTYQRLSHSSSKQERILARAIERTNDILKSEKSYGQKIQKKLIPKEYTQAYQITNLFRIRLPCFWRMLYTIRSTDKTVILFVLDIIDHKEYDKKFNYKKK